MRVTNTFFLSPPLDAELALVNVVDIGAGPTLSDV
jgi:hypothetical protein